MDCFGSLSQIWYAQLLLWLTRRRRADAGSCGFAIRHRVTSARLRPVLRRGAGRKRFRQAANTTVAHKLGRRLPNFGGAAAVGRKAERQDKMQKSHALKKRTPAIVAGENNIT
jgi:hypothetical protein